MHADEATKTTASANDSRGDEADLLTEIGHPKGTLAVLAIYMLLFILGWAALYFGEFLPRGTPDSRPDEPGIHQEAPAP
jgi:hypothetical protein